MRYSTFVVPLVKVVQEQQEIINSLKNQVGDLEKKIQEYDERLHQMTAFMEHLKASITDLVMDYPGT